jgi:hypothetical protein
MSGVEAPPEFPPMATRRLSEVAPEPIRWLWPGRIARGKLTVIAGNPGLGKSQLTASLAAIVTTGGLWPVDRTPADRGAVVILSAEDDAADTIVPRLVAAGADLTRCHVIDAALFAGAGGDPVAKHVDLSRDVAALCATLEGFGDVAMLAIDPAGAFLGGADSHKDSDVRGILAPLAAMAARLDIAVVLVAHLNKSGGGGAMSRVTGSLAFVAAARAAWLVAKDQQDPRRRLFLPLKNNLAADVDGLAFEIESFTLDNGIQTSRVSWRNEVVTTTADEALAPHDDSRAPRKTEAKTWLRDLLADGPRLEAEIGQLAEAADINDRTLRRAKKGLPAESVRIGGRWFWRLKSQGGQLSRHGNVVRLGHVGHVVPENPTQEGQGGQGGQENHDGESGHLTCQRCAGEGCAWCRS